MPLADWLTHPLTPWLLFRWCGTRGAHPCSSSSLCRQYSSINLWCHQHTLSIRETRFVVAQTLKYADDVIRIPPLPRPPRPPSTTRHLLRSKIIIILFFRSPRVCSTSSSGSSGLHTPQHSSATEAAEAALLVVVFWWSLWIRPQSIFDLHRKFLLLGENDSQTSKIRFPANWLLKFPPSLIHFHSAIAPPSLDWAPGSPI